MRKEYMGEFNVDVDQWFGGGPVQLWNENLPVRAALLALFTTELTLGRSSRLA